MLNWAKHTLKLCWPVIFAGVFLSACENDIKKIRELSANQVNMNIDTVHGVDIIFSDSARVKFRIQAPLLLQHTASDKDTGINKDKNNYNLMPDGVNIHIFDKDLTVMGTLTADTGIQRQSDNKIEFHKNVVATNSKGETFKSDELIWDQNTKLMHSDKVVQIRTADGDIINGIGFQSDQNLEHWTIDKSTGIFNVTEQETQ